MHKKKISTLLGASYFYPHSIDGLVTHLKLDSENVLYEDNAMTTPSDDGDVIGGILDNSGSGNNATQVTTNKKPIRRDGTIHSKTTVSMDCFTNKALDFSALFGESCTELTVIIVARCTKTNDLGFLWSSASLDFNTNNISLASYEGNWLLTGQKGETSYSYNTGIIVDKNPHFYCMRWNNTTIKLNVDNETYSNSAVLGAINLTNSTYGAKNISGTCYYHLQHRGYELIVYNRAITDYEVLKLQAYCQKRFETPNGKYYVATALGVGVNGSVWQPQLVRFTSGRLFTVFTEFDGDPQDSGLSVVKSAYSDDDGVTWSSGSNIVDGDPGGANNGSLLLLSNGNLICTYYRRATGGGLDTTAYYKISTDGGINWGDETYMGDLIGSNYYYVPYTNGLVLDDDTLLVPCFSEQGNNKIFLAKSINGGITWTYILIANGDGLAYDPFNECPIARRGNIIVCMIRHETDLHYYRSVSNDLGETWSTPVATTLVRSGFPALGYDGNILFLFDRSPVEFTPYCWYSWDDGVTWKKTTTTVDLQTTPVNYDTSHMLISGGRRYFITDAAGYILRISVSASGNWV